MNVFLKKGKQQDPSNAVLRVLQYMCITVLYQIVCFEFKKNYETLKQYVVKGHGMSKMLEYYKDVIFSTINFVDAKNLEKFYQEEYGYHLYIKFLVAATNNGRIKLEVPAKDPNSTKKRKHQQISQGNIKLDPATVELSTQRIVSLESRVQVLEERYSHETVLSQPKSGYLNLEQRLDSLEERVSLLEECDQEHTLKFDKSLTRSGTAEVPSATVLPETKSVQKSNRPNTKKTHSAKLGRKLGNQESERNISHVGSQVGSVAMQKKNGNVDVVISQWSPTDAPNVSVTAAAASDAASDAALDPEANNDVFANDDEATNESDSVTTASR